jgi:hypothetical protein
VLPPYLIGARYYTQKKGVIETDLRGATLRAPASAYSSPSFAFAPPHFAVSQGPYVMNGPPSRQLTLRLSR